MGKVEGTRDREEEGRRGKKRGNFEKCVFIPREFREKLQEEEGEMGGERGKKGEKEKKHTSQSKFPTKSEERSKKMNVFTDFLLCSLTSNYTSYVTLFSLCAAFIIFFY